MSIDIDVSSNRQHKNFWRNPVAFLGKKISSSEVNYRKLRPDERVLFDHAKNSEVTSFLKSEAVRRCLTWEEQQQAQKADRVLRARWVLVWKGVPRKIEKKLFWIISRMKTRSAMHQARESEGSHSVVGLSASRLGVVNFPVFSSGAKPIDEEFESLFGGSTGLDIGGPRHEDGLFANWN